VPGPVAVQTAFAAAEIIADASARTLVLDGREAGVVDLDDPRRLVFGYMRRIADLIDAFRPAGASIDVLHLGGGACARRHCHRQEFPRRRQRERICRHQ
jgi:hypothetical protein